MDGPSSSAPGTSARRMDTRPPSSRASSARGLSPRAPAAASAPGAAATAAAAAPLAPGDAPRPAACVTAWRLAALGAPLAAASLVLLSLTLVLPFQSYAAQNTAQTMQWGFASCYTVPTGIADGVQTVCDPQAPLRLVGACLGIDALALALALYVLAQPRLPAWVPGARAAPGSAEAGRVLLAARALGALRVAHLGMCAGALAIKTASLPATPWHAHLAGWTCLAAAIGVSGAALVCHLGLCYQEAWLEPLPSSVVQGYAPAAALAAVPAGAPLRKQPQLAALPEASGRAQQPRSSSSSSSSEGAPPAPSASQRRLELAARLTARSSSGAPGGATAPRLAQAVPNLPMELLRTRQV